MTVRPLKGGKARVVIPGNSISVLIIHVSHASDELHVLAARAGHNGFRKEGMELPLFDLVGEELAGLGLVLTPSAGNEADSNDRTDIDGRCGHAASASLLGQSVDVRICSAVGGLPRVSYHQHDRGEHDEEVQRVGGIRQTLVQQASTGYFWRQDHLHHRELHVLEHDVLEQERPKRHAGDRRHRGTHLCQTFVD
jgi:hypothetical protein